MAQCTVARPEITMIVHQHHKTGLGKGLSKTLQAVLFHTGIAMSHRDGGISLLRYCGREEPTAQMVAPFNLEFNVARFGHDIALAAQWGAAYRQLADKSTNRAICRSG